MIRKLTLAVIIFALFNVVVVLSQTSNESKISVTGTAEIYVQPDEAIINMGIKVWDEDMDDARAKFYENSEKLSTLLQIYNIDDKFIKTDMINIEPTYKKFHKQSYEGDIVSGYRFFKRISVTVKDIEKVEEMLTKIIYSGATNLYGVNYQTSEFREYMDQARKEAILAAKEKAEMLAAELGQSVGKAIKIEEPSMAGNPWGRSANVTMLSGSNESGPDIQPGMIKISASINVVFELE